MILCLLRALSFPGDIVYRSSGERKNLANLSGLINSQANRAEPARYSLFLSLSFSQPSSLLPRVCKCSPLVRPELLQNPERVVGWRVDRYRTVLHRRLVNNRSRGANRGDRWTFRTYARVLGAIVFAARFPQLAAKPRKTG